MHHQLDMGPTIPPESSISTEMACHLNEDNHSIFRLNLSLTDQMQGTKRVGDVEHGG